MTIKEKLQYIFNSDYPGTDAFINEVLVPVFGNDIDIVNIDQAEKEEYREKAAKAGLKKIVYTADIHDEEYRANNIAFFDVTVDNNVNVERARVNIQQVIRSIVDHHSHILIVFHYEEVKDKPWRFSYAYKHGSIANTTSAKRYTYVFGRDFRGRTAAERFETFKKSDHSNKALEEAFSVEALSDEFFDIYRAYYATFVEYITGEKYSDEKKLKNIMNGWNWQAKDTSDQFSTTFDRDAKATRDYIKKMFGRIVFLYFLQRKGWLYDNDGRSDAQYMKHLFDNSGSLQATFLDDVLEILFFYVLNTKPENRISEARMAHRDVTILPGWDKIPFLNGGLFEQDDIDPKKCTFPAEYFREFFNFLNSYNFTIDENDQEDAEIGIDPEMLGRIFENLLEDNKDKGAFYTPKPIVDYMCRESIIAYLQDDRYKPEGNELIRKFIETLNIDLLNEEQRIEIEKKLLKVKICDPAIGSGAFPMGLVNLLSKIFIVLRTYSSIDQAKMKRYIMQQSIYGVDIEKGAVDIARLRFWLAMVVDETEPQPLPNLHFKIMQGNSLLESFNGLNLKSIMKPETGRIDFITEEERNQLRKDLARFYAEDSHDKRLILMNNIKNTVIRMILNADPNSPLSGIDVSETEQFFMWHTWFADVFDNGGFDIVIGNPPYISTKGVSTYDKKNYEHEFGFSDDTYNLFTFKGLSLLRKGGNLSYIIPKTFWTTQTKRGMRDLILKNQVNYIYDTANPFETVMVDTCIIQVENSPFTKGHKVKFLDGTEDLINPTYLHSIPQDVYLNTQNSIIFKPTELNLKIYELYGKKVKELYDKWWPKIETSKKISQNKSELENYRASLKPGDVALLGCLTEGGQGLATANNGKYIAVRSSTKWANNIIESRPKKLAEAIRKKKIKIREMENFIDEKEYLDSLTEKEIAQLFDSLKEGYGRDIFGQGYIYKIIDDNELANIDELTDDEKENGIDVSKNHYVPYDKGDKDGNRWYLETPFAIDWSKENVHFLKTDPKARYQGYSFYFREGLCWSDINTTYLKCRKKSKSIHDVKSMSLFGITDLVSEEYIITMINSSFISLYVDNFVNNTQTFQINDARQLPIIIPTFKDNALAKSFVENAIQIKLKDYDTTESLNAIQKEVDTFVAKIYNL